MAALIANGTNVWVVVPASPPLRLTIRACLDDHCRQCGLPVYRCESEGGQMMSLFAGHLRLRLNHPTTPSVLTTSRSGWPC
jgi:hypothetical protein